MKKLAIALLLSAAIMMTGCQGDKTGDTPAASKTEEVNQASDELKEKLGDGYILPSEAVTKVLAKKWDVVGTESVYDLKEDGTGTLDGKALTFECGFDEDDNITMGIKMDGEEKEQLYAIEDDTTGYGRSSSHWTEARIWNCFSRTSSVLIYQMHRHPGFWEPGKMTMRMNTHSKKTELL